MIRPGCSKRPAATSLVIAVALATVAAVTFAGPGMSASAKPFAATISPTHVAAGSTSGFSYTITDATSPANGSVPSNQPLGSAQIVIPDGWTVGATMTAVAQAADGTVLGTSWTPTLTSTGRIEVDANTQSDRLAGGQRLVLTFTATAPAACAGPRGSGHRL